MNRRQRRSVLIRAAFALVTLVLAGGPWIGVEAHSAHAASLEPLNVTVEVSYKGFNGESGYTVEAARGQEVNVTFVWADNAVPDNAHRIHIEGYELETQILKIDNREDTLSFVADKPGSFLIECNWRCEGHKEALQNAALKVSGSAGGSSSGASYVATSLAFGGSVLETDGGPVALSATLQDEEGGPIAGANVRFSVLAEFAGTEGLMEVGAVETDENGTALYEYTPTFDGDQTIIARFEGLGLYQETEASFPISVQGAEPAYSVPPAGLHSLRQWAPFGVALVVGAVWLTFLYAGLQMYRLARNPIGGGADEF